MDNAETSQESADPRAIQVTSMNSCLSTSIREVWSDVLRFRWVLIGLMLLEFIARAQSITAPMYSIDGYFANPDRTGETPIILANGRWGLVAMLWLRGQLGYEGMDVVPSALILSVVLLTGAGFLYARVLLKTFDAAELGIFVALFTLHPFNTELYTFSDATLNNTLPVFLVGCGLTVAGTTVRSWLGVATGGFLMLIALSIYQLAIAHAVIVSMLAIAERTIELFRNQPARGRLRQVLAMAPTRGLAVAMAAATLSLIASMIIVDAFHIAFADGRARLPDLSLIPDLAAKAAGLAGALRMVFMPPAGIVPPAASIILIGILVFSAISLLLTILRRSGVGIAFVSGGLLAAAAISSAIIPLAANFIWLVPRVLSPFSILVAGLATLGWRCVRLSWVRHTFAAALIVLLLSYVGSSNRILYDQRRVNLWDVQQANRILRRFEDDPKFRNMGALALVHGNSRNSALLPTTFGDMNISAFATKTAKLALMEQATGMRFAAPSKAESQVAETYCASADVWPAAGSVVIVGSLGIVCLPRP